MNITDLKIAKECSNLNNSRIVELAILKKEAVLGMNGALIVNTGKYTGRCPKDRFIVDNIKTDSPKKQVHWGAINQKISQENFDKIMQLALDYAKDKELYNTECFCGATLEHRLKVRFITEITWHGLFLNNMFISASEEELAKYPLDFTVLNVGKMQIQEPQKYGLNSEVFILFDYQRKIGLVGGTEYSGELKKGIFSYMNYLLPSSDILPMHCSANKSADGDTALFFGLSGTGKTTLSADTNRILIGDDEHGWSKDGIFNFEGGCYAKAIHLSKENEPTIWNAIQYSAILENVIFDNITREVDFDSDEITENTRISYSLELIENADETSTGRHPNNIIFLTADASGVLPPVARLTPEQAVYYFLSGYTSKVAGTESGITEPQAAFSACFGEPFMVLAPEIYGDLLEQKIRQHKCNIFLVNTGWFGGGYGKGKRISIQVTRSIITSIHNGSLLKESCEVDDIFGFAVPKKIPQVLENIDPKKGWNNPQDYQEAKKELAKKFVQNFNRFQGKLDRIKKVEPQV